MYTSAVFDRNLERIMAHSKVLLLNLRKYSTYDLGRHEVSWSLSSAVKLVLGLWDKHWHFAGNNRRTKFANLVLVLQLVRQEMTLQPGVL